jgi:type IV pilus assembly protein PilV
MTYFPKLNSRGFTLIETLVAILILGLGLLGMLGVIINSLKLSSSSTYRTIAGQQAYAIAEALRANPSLLATASGVAAATTFNNPTAAISASCMTVGQTCNRATYVGNEFAMWQAQLKSVLPSGWGTICQDPNSPPTAPDTSAANAATAPAWGCGTSGPYVVKICWDETRVSASAGQASNGFLCTWTSL